MTAPELEGRLSTHSRMHRALAGGAMTVKALAVQLDVPESSIRVALTRDAKSGRPQFVRLGDGRIGISV